MKLSTIQQILKNFDFSKIIHWTKINMKNKFLQNDNYIIYIVIFLQVVAFALFLFLLSLIIWKYTIQPTTPLGILISALLAYYSVDLSIRYNKKLKSVELSNNIKYLFFNLCIVKMRLIGLEKEKKRQNITYLDLDRIVCTFKEINEMLIGINNSDIISTIHDKSYINDFYF